LRRSPSNLPVAFGASQQLQHRRYQVSDCDVQPVTMLDIRAHFLRLTAADRYLRFGAPINDESVHHYLTHADAYSGVTLGYSDNGHVRGVVELRRSVERADCLELAVSVESNWRGRGHGTRLVRSALAVAVKLKVESVVALISHTNKDMAMIAAKLGATIVTHYDGSSAEWMLGKIDRSDRWDHLAQLFHEEVGESCIAYPKSDTPRPTRLT
jgi:GNAT superfamily N-acetyltransferase